MSSSVILVNRLGTPKFFENLRQKTFFFWLVYSSQTRLFVQLQVNKTRKNTQNEIYHVRLT